MEYKMYLCAILLLSNGFFFMSIKAQATEGPPQDIPITSDTPPMSPYDTPPVSPYQTSPQTPYNTPPISPYDIPPPGGPGIPYNTPPISPYDIPPPRGSGIPYNTPPDPFNSPTPIPIDTPPRDLNVPPEEYRRPPFDRPPYERRPYDRPPYDRSPYDRSPYDRDPREQPQGSPPIGTYVMQLCYTPQLDQAWDSTIRALISKAIDSYPPTFSKSWAASGLGSVAGPNASPYNNIASLYYAATCTYREPDMMESFACQRCLANLARNYIEIPTRGDCVRPAETTIAVIGCLFHYAPNPVYQ